MDSILGIIMTFLVFGLIERFSKKAKANRNTSDAPARAQTFRRVPPRPAVIEEPEEPEEGEAHDVQMEMPIAVPQPAISAQPTVPAQPMPLVRAALEKAPLELEQKKPEEKLSLIEKSLKAAGKGKRVKKAAHLKSGESAADGEGCIGGSLGAHTEEGESRAEHAAHLKRRDEALAAENSIARQAAALRSASVSELRRAVVMSEILDKPVALRRR